MQSKTSSTSSRWLKRILVGTTVSTGALIVAGGFTAMAADDFDAEKAVTTLGQQTSLLWIVIGAA